MPNRPADRWILGEGQSIEWNVPEDRNLPHSDFIEQSGRLVSQVVTYRVDADRTLSLHRSLAWPTLRTIPNDTHASLVHHYSPEIGPAISLNEKPLGPITVHMITHDGLMTVRGTTDTGMDVERVLFPTTEHRATMEKWTLRNAGNTSMLLSIAPLQIVDYARGCYGVYVLEVSHDAPARISLDPGQALTFGVTFTGHIASDPPLHLDICAEEEKRRVFVSSLQQALRLETPDPILNQAFGMAKIRCAESVYATRGGLMLGPGGLSYYAAVWCNDNVEYAGPFFPFLGDPGGNQASIDTYRIFRPFMGPDFHPIPSSIISEGNDIWEGAGDRGDAAMYAYGAARFCLARGSRAIAEELWPAIEWCLEYCSRQITPDGVIASDSDELEGRFSTGKANLSTACLAYGGLRSSADLGRALGKIGAANEYDRRAAALARAIESYFGANIQGFDTYRYHAGCDRLRSWICLPLCMGISDRRKGTMDALFSPHLWTPDGLATQAGDATFWDRSTLYGLRGVFQAGETEKALHYLTAYIRRRLLGEHVPYPVEAYPEGGARHLSAESALYCRVFTEGLFGIIPTGLDCFQCTPRLPMGWDRMSLQSIRAFERDFDLVVERVGKEINITVLQDGQTVSDWTAHPGETVEIRLPA